MYLLYIDESDTTDSRNELTPRWYCVSGMCIVDSSYRKSQEEWLKLLKLHRLPSEFELKGEELYQGTGFWKNIKPEVRIEFSKAVCTFIKSSNLKIYSCLEIVKNSNHIKSYNNLLSEILKMVPRYISTSSISSRQLILIFDQRNDIENKIRVQIKSCRTSIITKFKKSCAFIDYGFDTDSKLCWGIQVADFVAYLLRRQQIFQRSNNLFSNSDSFLSIETVDNLISSIKKKCIVKYLSKKSFYIST